jgi:DNA repair protein RadA/Sms
MKSKPASKATHAIFFCTACGNESPKWFGKCPACGEWNTAAEAPPDRAGSNSGAGRKRARGTTPGLGTRTGYSGDATSVPIKLDAIEIGAEDRWRSGITELDRVLGGGLVPGSLVLIGGDPGVGKSTLALGLASALARQNRTVLYVTGEESPRQTKMRAERLALKDPDSPIYVQAEVDLEAIIAQVEALNPALLVVDSIQTLYTPVLDAAPGSVSQVRECGLRLLRLAKDRSLPILLIGHVTKDGADAGPRTLEHMVDAVL